MIIGIILTILIGALIGWLAGILMKSKHGFWMNCLVGIVGSFIGGWLAGLLGIGTGVLYFICEIAGTCILIALLRLIMGKKW